MTSSSMTTDECGDLGKESENKSAHSLLKKIIMNYKIIDVVVQNNEILKYYLIEVVYEKDCIKNF